LPVDAGRKEKNIKAITSGQRLEMVSKSQVRFKGKAI
jgi:hypothetical protein